MSSATNVIHLMAQRKIAVWKWERDRGEEEGRGRKRDTG